MKKHSFKKSERLKRKKHIDLLFKSGSALTKFPLKTLALLQPASECDLDIQVLIAVPKKVHAKAVQRNKFKRYVREAYRQHKTILQQGLLKEQSLLLAFLYSDKKERSCREIEELVVSALHLVNENFLKES